MAINKTIKAINKANSKLVAHHRFSSGSPAAQKRHKGGPLSAAAFEPLTDHQRTDEQNSSGPPVGTAVGPPTLPLVGRQWAANLMLSGISLLSSPSHALVSHGGEQFP